MTGLSTAALLWAALGAQVQDSTLLAAFSSVRSAAARFRYDLAHASPELVLARARDVRAACVTAQAAADSLAPRLAANATRRDELSLVQRALAGCVRDWESSSRRVHADSLRAWGPHRLQTLNAALRRFEQRGMRDG